MSLPCEYKYTQRRAQATVLQTFSCLYVYTVCGCTDMLLRDCERLAVE